MKSEEFDRAFDDGEDVTSQLDISAARRPGLAFRRREAPALGVVQPGVAELAAARAAWRR
jgi:hypothetical protein